MARWLESLDWLASAQSDDVEAASWIGPRLRPFSNYQLGSVVPTGFAAYVRVDSLRGIARVLRRHTSTAERTWLCLWEGYGYLHPGSISYVWASTDPKAKPPPPPPPPPGWRPSRVHLPNRDYMLFVGAVEDGEGWDDGPNLWWPDDRAWCVAWEIDLDYALVGGTDDLCDELISAGARRVSVDDPTA